MRVVVIGASRGIGLGLAEAYRDAGHEVVTSTRDDTGDVRLDVGNPDQFAALSARLGDAPVDLLICNAGIYRGRGRTLDGYSAEDWAESFAVNVTGVFLAIRTLLPNLRAAGGRIAIISSQMASDTTAPGGSYAYRASKAAVLNLGRNLATDLGPEGVAVGIYHPGWVRTDMGGGSADITVAQSVAGLMAEFDRLDIAHTGAFRTWDGRDHPF